MEGGRDGGPEVMRMESISTGEGGTKTHKEITAVRRRRRCPGCAPGVAPTTHFTVFLQIKGLVPGE